jgi:hypothetical protein
VGEKTVFLEDEEGAIQDVWGSRSDGGCDSLTSETTFSLFERQRGQRASWLASFSLRRPPRRAGMGVREIARRPTSPRCSSGNKSAACNAWRSLAAKLTKTKNTKCCNSNCLFYCDFPEIIRTHLVHIDLFWEEKSFLPKKGLFVFCNFFYTKRQNLHYKG